MLRSMYAGISGMKNFQTKLDVIGNNISNVNTSGFKKGRVTFEDMMSQMTSGAQGPTANRGGVNPAQVGLGSQLGSIDNIHTQGFRQTTNNPLDFALEGDGMFIVRDGDSEFFTRAGNFYLDQQGNVVNAQGLYLMGFQLDAAGNPLMEDGEGNAVIFNGENFVLEDDTDTIIEEDDVVYLTSEINIPETAQSFSVQTNGMVNYIDQAGNNQVAGQIAIANFSNPAGLEKAGSNLFLNSANAGYNGVAFPETEGTASIVSGSLEMSNVDLSEEFTEMITAQRGFQANTRIITTSDEILQELVNLKR